MTVSPERFIGRRLSVAALWPAINHNRQRFAIAARGHPWCARWSSIAPFSTRSMRGTQAATTILLDHAAGELAPGKSPAAQKI
jgi:hypothetical protein